MDALSIAMENIVPISAFSRGGAGQIFEDLDRGGPKIVVKNNVPAGVVLSPSAYKSLMDEISDTKLALLAMERLTKNKEVLYSQDDVVKESGFTPDDLKNVEVDIE